MFLYTSDADILMKALQSDPLIQVTLAESPSDQGSVTCNEYRFTFERYHIKYWCFIDDIYSTSEIRVDDEASILPTVADLSSDGMVEKLRSEVKRIVVERMKEEAEQLKKSTESIERAKGTFIIRMDEKGSIVTEAVGGDNTNTHLESFTVDPEDVEKSEKEEEEKKVRRAFITLLRMTVHLLLALQDEQQPKLVEVLPERTVDLSDLSDDIHIALLKVFQSNKANINHGIARRSIDDVLSSFRVLWPENILPRRHFGQLEQILLRLARDPADGQSDSPDSNQWDKEKGEKLIQFMRSIRGEFATHLRQFYSKVADRSGLNGVHEPKPNRTPDEL